jgi:hypothetical protein
MSKAVAKQFEDEIKILNTLAIRKKDTLLPLKLSKTV